MRAGACAGAETQQASPPAHEATKRARLSFAYSRDDQARAAKYAAQCFLKTSVPFVPPKPNEFFSATSIFISRASFAQ